MKRKKTIARSPGRGKTTAVRNYIKNLNSSLYKVTYTSLSTLTVSEFYKHLTNELGLTPVIIIDEANYINNAVLNDLKMLFNFEISPTPSLLSGFIFSYLRCFLMCRFLLHLIHTLDI